jgi:hypothetical protein
MNNLSKECMDLIRVRSKYDDDILTNVSVNAMFTALTTPSIYKAANLIESTPLEGRKSADEILAKNINCTHLYYDRDDSAISINQALNAMEEYANQFKAEWISVEDGLPKTNATHWVYFKEIHKVFTGMFDPYSKKWFHDYGNAVVTNWANISIPKPPKS